MIHLHIKDASMASTSSGLRTLMNSCTNRGANSPTLPPPSPPSADLVTAAGVSMRVRSHVAAALTFQSGRLDSDGSLERKLGQVLHLGGHGSGEEHRLSGQGAVSNQLLHLLLEPLRDEGTHRRKGGKTYNIQKEMNISLTISKSLSTSSSTSTSKSSKVTE